MKKIFISYSSTEYETARKFHDAFSAHGMSCWMAPESIPVGSNYAIEIPNAIQECQVFVLILSENSQKSIWVRKEIDLAVNLQKLIFPIRIGNYGLISPFDFYLTDIQLAQASDDPAQIAVKLEQLLGPSTPDTTATPNKGDAPAVLADKSGKKKNKKILIAIAAAIVIAVGAGIGIAISKNAPDAGDDITSSMTESKNTTDESSSDVVTGDIKNVTDLEFTFIYDTGKSCTGKFSGQAINGTIPCGNGTFIGTDKDGSTISYEGGWSDGKKHGQGVQTVTCTDGTVKTKSGEFANNMLNGQGIFKNTYTSGNFKVYSYEGNFVDDKWQGQGTQTNVYSDGKTILWSGEFIDGKLNGYGTSKATYTTGDTKEYVYEGNWVDQKAHGQGTKTFTYTNGDIKVYSGQWENGNFIG